MPGGPALAKLISKPVPASDTWGTLTALDLANGGRVLWQVKPHGTPVAQPTVQSWLRPHPLRRRQSRSSAAIMEASTLMQARPNATVQGIVAAGAPFAEGHELSARLMASVPPTQVGRMMSGAEAAELLRRLEGRPKPPSVF